MRFAVGGVVTVATGLVGKIFGPVVGGLFLAFPAIFPTSLVMLERLENERAGPGARGDRARRAAIAEAAGAAMGSVGLIAFAGVTWFGLPRVGAAATLAASSVGWAAFALVSFVWRRRPRGDPGRRSSGD